MLSFAFVSLPHPSHCDLGGMGFVGCAGLLREQGHRVSWIFARPFDTPLSGTQSKKARELLATHGIQAEQIVELDLIPLPLRLSYLSKSVNELEAHIRERGYDCVVIDRSCSAAAVAAHRARVPWAAVGTDGRDWVRSGHVDGPRETLVKTPMERNLDRVLGPLIDESFPSPIVSSTFATSPFLNISFLPRAFYPPTVFPVPEHSHFVGAGGEPGAVGDGECILITFGNTMARPVRRALLTTMLPILNLLRLPAMILTGERASAELLNKQLGEGSQIEVREWMPYEEAYGIARTVVGHGGHAHVWHGLHKGATLLSVPWFSDQWFGARQTERLGMGRIAEPRTLGGERLGLKVDGAKLDARDLAEKLEYLYTSPEPRSRAIEMSSAIRTGGGIEAAAGLLLRLARDGSPVVECEPARCCC